MSTNQQALITEAYSLIYQFLGEMKLTSTQEQFVNELGISRVNFDVYNPKKSLLEILREKNSIDIVDTFNNLNMTADNCFTQSCSLEMIPVNCIKTLGNIHSKNILSLDTTNEVEGSFSIVSGSSDRTLCVTRTVDGQTTRKFSFPSPILAVHVHPFQKHICIISYMDFSHSHVDLLTGTILKRWSEHTKYVNQAKFSPDGDFFITGSYDHTLRIYSFHGLQLLKVFYFQGNVESTCFSNDSQTLIVGVRGDNYLHYINMATFDDVKVNMNSNGDDWVSFTPMDISMHPSGKYILISTDASQILLMKFGSSVHVKRFYGLATDAYSMPRNCWHSSGTIFFAVGDDSLIYVFDVASECVLTTLKGHNGVVRALKYDERTDLLITGSFDNSIKVWANECIMNSK